MVNLLLFFILLLYIKERWISAIDNCKNKTKKRNRNDFETVKLLSTTRGVFTLFCSDNGKVKAPLYLPIYLQ